MRVVRLGCVCVVVCVATSWSVADAQDSDESPNAVVDTEGLSLPSLLTLDQAVQNTLADTSVRSKRIEFGLQTDDTTVETAVRQSIARGVAGSNPLGIALTDAELKAAEAWNRWVQELDRYSSFASAHSAVTAGYESNHDIDDPEFYIQVTRGVDTELVERIARLMPVGLPYELRTVPYSSDEVFEAARAVEQELAGGVSVGVNAALRSVGLGALTRVMLSPSSQAVRVGVDVSSEELSLSVERGVGDALPLVRGVPLELVSYQGETAPQGRTDSPGQPKAGLRITRSTTSCTSAGSILAPSYGLYNITAGHCAPLGGEIFHQGVSWGTVSTFHKDIAGTLTIRALDYAFASAPSGGMVSEYVMEVSDTTGASSLRTITGTNAATETTSWIVCYGGASSNRPLIYSTIPYRTLCGWIVNTNTNEGRVQVSVNVCKKDSGALVYLNSAAVGIVSRSASPINGTNNLCFNQMSYARMLNQFADISGGAMMIGQSWGIFVFNHSGQCLDAAFGGTASPTPTNQYTCLAGVPQRWRFIPVNNGIDSDVYYVVRNDGPYCLDSAATWDGSPVYQYGCHYNANQQWRIVRTVGNGFSLRPLSSPTKCVEIPAGSLSPGVGTELRPCSGVDYQNVHL